MAFRVEITETAEREARRGGVANTAGLAKGESQIGYFEDSMVSCCAELEKHCQKTEQDGFRIDRGFWLLPYEVRKTFLSYQMAGQSEARIEINFCPWCGCDLHTPSASLHV
jgi:hypothetical protein